MSTSLSTTTDNNSSAELPAGESMPGEVLAADVVLLTNFIPPYALPVYVELAKRVRKLTVLLSTPMEANRPWQPDWGGLDVRVCKTWTLKQRWRHKVGFSDPQFIHVPWNTAAILAELAPDAIVSIELGARSLFAAVYKFWQRRAALVLWANLSEHTEQGRGLLRYMLRRWLLGRADCVAVNGLSGARYLQSMGVAPDRLARVPYCAVPNTFETLPLTRPSEAAHRMLCVGQLIDRKGLLPFVAALAEWAAAHGDRQVELTLVGSGPLKDAIENAPRPANLTLTLAGECNYQQLLVHFANSGILAFPTLADEWGLVVNEALAAGLPVLGSLYSQAVGEVIEPGKTGWTFHPDRHSEIVQAIDAALNTTADELAAMRPVGRAAIADRTPAIVAGQMAEAIRQALARRAERGA